MPTGYTAKLVEEGQSFPEFVMTCSRNFMATIMMRDDPLDAPIPEAFEPSDYHLRELAQARKTLDELRAMTPEQQIEFGESAKQSDIDRYKAWLGKEVIQNARVDEMRGAVLRWTPPANHRELKNFMLDQLRISRNDTDYIVELIAKTEKKDPMEFYREAVEHAIKEIGYNTTGHEQEIERVRQRNEWLRQLRESIVQNQHGGEE